MIYLRPHHLLCLLTYIGKGYSAGFVANYDRIVARLNAGEEITITAGPDDICAPIACDLKEHCHRESVLSRDCLAARDVGKLLGQPIKPGDTLILSPHALPRLRDAFAKDTIRAACDGCEWHNLCTEIAARGYTDVRLTSLT